MHRVAVNLPTTTKHASLMRHELESVGVYYMALQETESLILCM